MWNEVASLCTPTAQVHVNEISWSEARESSHTLPAPTITLVLIGREHRVEASYVGEPWREFSAVGRVVFTPPRTEIIGRALGGSGRIRLVTCEFDPEHAERLVGSFDNLSHSQLRSCLNVRSTLLPTLLSQLMKEAMQPGFASAAIVESLAQAMLLECSRTIRAQDRQHKPRARLTSRHFKIIDEYLASLTNEAPSVSALARACGFSEGHFSRLFREQMQQSLGRYLKSVQISKAQAYLLGTDLPVKEIAFKLGFSAASNFSAAFREATGFTPARYRALHRSSPSPRSAAA